jgi:O-methyltransferase
MRRRLVMGAMSAAKRLGLTKLIRALVARLPSRFGGRFEAHVYAIRRSAGDATGHVAAEELEHNLTQAINLLRGRLGTDEIGDYLEFGVYAGGTMTCADRARRAAGIERMRLIGFDSFEGLPPEAEEVNPERWSVGMFACSPEEARENMRRGGVDVERVQLVKGWFDEVLNDETRRQHAIERAGVIMLDCDLYSSTRAALEFSAPAIGPAAVLICDDWRHSGEDGQQRAFEEFLERHRLEAQALGHYRASGMPDGGRVFLVERAA